MQTPENIDQSPPPEERRSGVDDRRLVRGLPQRVVKSRKPSTFAKSGITSSFRDDVTVDQHSDDLQKFITANAQGMAAAACAPKKRSGGFLAVAIAALLALPESP